VTPMPVLERFGSDAVRYWASSARLGIDTAVDEGQIKVGRRLAIKLLNVSRFVLSMEAAPGEISAALDRSMLSQLRGVVIEATDALRDYEHARALDTVERSFWGFCDDFVELVKSRAYGGSGAGPAGSAVAALRLALETYLRLLAPFLPYVTEEVWSWWRDGSVHRSTWPTTDELDAADDAGEGIYAAAAAVLGEIRKAKAEAKVSLKVRASLVVVHADGDLLQKLALAESDVVQAGNVEALERREAEGLTVEVTLEPVA